MGNLIMRLFLILLFFSFSVQANTNLTVEQKLTTKVKQCRDSAEKHKFDILQGYPKGRFGYIVDHICALECGGIDDPINMQYQTLADSKAKDRWERTTIGCKATCTSKNSQSTRTVFNCK